MIVTPSGGAIVPGYETTPILMDEAQTVTLAGLAPGARIVAIHLKSLDHCGVTRKSLREAADARHISEQQFIIPEDGKRITLL